MSGSAPEPVRAAVSVVVSVVVPAFNVETFLAAALDRLLAQTHPAVEIVVVDDASTDGTAQIGRGYAARHDRVVFLAQATNTGVAAAREGGVRQATGDYVWFVDADDDWSDDAVAVMLDSALRSGADVVCASARYVSPGGAERPVGKSSTAEATTGVAAFEEFLHGRITGHLWNKLFTRSVLAAVDFTRSRHHSDQAMVAQALAAAHTVAFVDSVVYRYVLRTGSIIRSGSPRAESLATVATVVRDVAVHVDPALLRSWPYRYFRARFELLSRLKDATSGAHPPAQAAELLRQARREITPDLLVALLRERDLMRLVLLGSARVSGRAYRRIMSRPGARD